jgi:hypothetical protein
MPDRQLRARLRHWRSLLAVELNPSQTFYRVDMTVDRFADAQSQAICNGPPAAIVASLP